MAVVVGKYADYETEVHRPTFQLYINDNHCGKIVFAFELFSLDKIR